MYGSHDIPITYPLFDGEIHRELVQVTGCPLLISQDLGHLW